MDKRAYDNLVRDIPGLSAVDSKIASPLTDCLRKRATGPLILRREAFQAFEELNKAFQDGPILRHFNPYRPIRIETDAS